MRTWVQTPVLELNWSELEAVVAGVGKGPPSCLVYATVCPSQTPPGRVEKEKYGQGNKDRKDAGEEEACLHLIFYDFKHLPNFWKYL